MKKLCVALMFLLLVFFAGQSYAKDLTFAQITDTNFTLDFDDTVSEETAKQFKIAIKEINKNRDVDFVVFTGNSVKHPDKKELAAFFKLANKLNKPYYVVIGNKEVLRYRHFTKKNFMHTAWQYNSAMRFKDENYIFKPNGDIVFIVLDGVNEMIPVPSGYYRRETLDWLDEQLKKYKNKKVVILQHFPIVPPTDKPSYNSVDADKYLQLLNSYDNVIAVVSGHYNANVTTYKKGVYHISSPAFSAPYYRYKLININYNPKYLHSSPAEFAINQTVKNMVEQTDEVQKENIVDKKNMDASMEEK